MIATARNSVARLKHLEEAGAKTHELNATASQATMEAKMNDILQVYHDVDVLVNNAGYIEGGLLEEVR